MEVRTLEDASGYGGQQYYVDNQGRFAGLVPANQPTTPAINEPTYINNNVGDDFGQIVPAGQAPQMGKVSDPLVYGPFIPNSDGEIPIMQMDLDTNELYESPVKGLDPVQPPASNLTPLQQLAQAMQGKIDEVGFDTYKKRDDEYNVRFDDGSSLFDQGLLDQYGVSKSDFADALRGYGNYIGSVGNRQSAGSGFEQGLENILNPEEAQQAFQYSLAYNKKEDKEQKQRDATRQMLDDQVEGEAVALGMSPDQYYNLPFTTRAQMAGSDITELFGGADKNDYGDYGGYEDIEDPLISRRDLGALGDANLKRFQPAVDAAKDKYYLDNAEMYDVNNPLFDIDPANVLSYDELVAQGRVDPITGDVSMYDNPNQEGVYGEGVETPYDFYGVPSGFAVDENNNLIPAPPEGFTIPGTDITITAPDGDGPGAGSNSGDKKGSFSKKRDVYGNPIRLTKGGSSWWKMAANWTNPSARIDELVTVDEQGNYITSDNRLVPPELIETALLTPTDITVKTGSEDYQVPYNDMENYNALYSGEINQEPLPVLQEQQVLNVSEPIIKP